MAAKLRRRGGPALDGVCVVRWGGQVEVLGHVPAGGLSVREGDPLHIDGCLHGLKQGVPLLRVKLEVPFSRITPPPRLEGERGLKKQR